MRKSEGRVGFITIAQADLVEIRTIGPSENENDAVDTGSGSVRIPAHGLHMKDPPISALYPYQSSYYSNVPRAIVDIMNWNSGTFREIYPFILLNQFFDQFAYFHICKSWLTTTKAARSPSTGRLLRLVLQS